MLSENIFSLNFCPPNICDPNFCPPIFMTSLRRCIYIYIIKIMGRDLAPNLGGPKKIFAAQFQEKFPFFLVIDLALRIFPFFSHIFRMFTMLNVVYDHFLTRKTQFFTLFMLSCTSDNTTSKNIGGTNAWAVPPPQILGGPSPHSPLGIRP